MWAGVRSDPSRCVVFAAPSSAARVSGQISSHVIAVFISKLQQITSCVPVLEASIRKSSFLEFCRRSGKPQTRNRTLSSPRGFPQLCVMEREISQIILKPSKAVTQRGKSTNMTSEHLLECLFSPEGVKSPSSMADDDVRVMSPALTCGLI